MSRFKPPFRGDMTLREAQDTLRPLLDEGKKCPCCTQFAKVYKRKVHTKMARDLIVAARAGGWDDRNWINVGEVIGRSSPDLVKCRYWGLIEKQEGQRDDGSNRLGLWRLTFSGLEFVRGRVTIQKYVKIYDSRCLGLVGELVTIQDALGRRFNYDELMAGV